MSLTIIYVHTCDAYSRDVRKSHCPVLAILLLPATVIHFLPKSNAPSTLAQGSLGRLRPTPSSPCSSPPSVQASASFRLNSPSPKLYTHEPPYHLGLHYLYLYSIATRPGAVLFSVAFAFTTFALVTWQLHLRARSLTAQKHVPLRLA